MIRNLSYYYQISLKAEHKNQGKAFYIFDTAFYIFTTELTEIKEITEKYFGILRGDLLFFLSQIPSHWV